MKDALSTQAAPPPTVVRRLVCGGCGYDLNSATGRCPECGRRFDPNITIDALIPWERRPHLSYAGRLQAYLQTVRLITFQPHRIGRFLELPVNLKAARRFRRVTVLLAFLPLLGMGLIAHLKFADRYGNAVEWRNEPLLIVRNPWSLGVCLAGLLLGLSVATRITAAFFDRRALPAQRRQRAAAMGQYASAPLAMAAVLALPIIFCWWVRPPAPSSEASEMLAFEITDRLFASLPYVGGAFALLWLCGGLRLLRIATGCSWRRAGMSATAIAPVWLICVIGIPAMALLCSALIVLMALSFGS